jgi:hypothetical protein
MVYQPLKVRGFFMIMNKYLIGFFAAVLLYACAGANENKIGDDDGPKIADHTVVHALWDGRIPESALAVVKDRLTIGFGHNSHGFQISNGMKYLVPFANAGNLGGRSYSRNLLDVSQDGSTGLHLFDGSGYVDSVKTDWLSGDAGYANNHFAEETREFLKNRSHSDFNVIMWSWCGQVSTASVASIDSYLAAMEKLEADYPDVVFIYMTGHLDGTGTNGNLQLRNEQIRRYCRDNDKWLFDFADIESYDPDGNSFLGKYGTDGCNYDADGNGVVSVDTSTDPPTATGNDKNWAVEWQSAHVGWDIDHGQTVTSGMDYYYTDYFKFSHTQYVNANMKAYAAWWMWARIAGWDGTLD